MKNLRPINQNVLLELPQALEQKTASGIYVPNTAIKEKTTGKVMAISNIENPEFSVGDTVLYKDFVGTKIDFDGSKFLLIQYADILAKFIETEEI